MNRTKLLTTWTLLLLLTPALAWGQAAPDGEALRALKLEALLAVSPVLLDPASEEADRLGVATLLVKTGEVGALPLLSQALRADPFASVRRAVAEGISGLGAIEASFPLQAAAAAAPTSSIRWAAGVSLVRLDPARADVIDALLSEKATLSAAALSLQGSAAAAGLPEPFRPSAIQAFVTAFPDPAYNSVERAAMLKALAELGAQGAVPLMREALNDAEDDPFVRGAAAFSLGRLGAREAVPALIFALDSGQDALQIGALDALARLAAPEALPPLTDVLREAASAEIRAAAANALSAYGQAAVPALTQALENDPSPAVRQAALTGLKAIGSETAAQAIVDFAGGDYLVTCDPQACSGLALELMSALAGLGRGELALALLTGALDALEAAIPFVYAFAEDDLVRAASEVGRAAPATFDLLLGHDNAFVQAVGLAALAQVRGPRARATLVPFVDPEGNRLLRRVALEGLAPHATADDVDLFAPWLADRDRRTRGAAFDALARAGDARALEALRAALGHASLSVRLQATEAAFAYANRWLAGE